VNGLEPIDALADASPAFGCHLEVKRRRREWFERMAESYLALWWVPAGQLPAWRTRR
jgi:hypothetical protein